MQYLDHRLSEILSNIRIEQAQHIGTRRHTRGQHGTPLRQRLGRWLIQQGESLVDGEPRAA
jgi:hypothetical protein